MVLLVIRISYQNFSCIHASCSVLSLLGGFHDKSLVDMWDDTTTSDGGLDQSVELLVSSDGELQVSWCDSLNLKILGSVTGEFQDLSGQILEDCCAVDS